VRLYGVSRAYVAGPIQSCYHRHGNQERDRDRTPQHRIMSSFSSHSYLYDCLRERVHSKECREGSISVMPVASVGASDMNAPVSTA
jgi:hypothetical protein